MTRFVTVNRDTAYLLPPSVDDWLPKDHLARFVVEIVDQLDLSALTRQYRGSGSDAYHPSVMLGLFIYGYATGVFSSRRIEAATYESVAFRYIAANEQPDHDSLCTFRKRFLKEEARPLALAGVAGQWAARWEVEENFFAVAGPEELPHLVLAFERLDPPGENP